MTRSTRLVLVLALLALTLALTACKKPVKERLYFDDLVASAGAGKVTVVEDISANPPGGGEITVRAVVPADIDRDELDTLMKSFYRQVKDRRGFQGGGGKPQKFDLRFYTDPSQAKAGGDGWLGKAAANSRSEEPIYENKQKAPLLKWATEALGKMPQYTGELQAKITADPEKMAVELTLPFVEMDGSGKYVEKLSYERFTSDWSSLTHEIFSRIEGLQKFTFIGLHNDAQVAKVTMTRLQFEEMQMKDVLENELSAFQGQFVTQLMDGSITEKKVMEKVAKQRRLVFGKLLGKLPPEQVELDKSLQ